MEVLTSAEPERNPWTVNTDGIRVHRYPNTSVQRDLSYGQRLLARCIRSLKDTFIGGPLRLIGDLFLPVNYGIRWDLNTEELMTSLRRPDVIIATVPHWDTMDHAMRLANIWKCQFLVDHRDPWNIAREGVYLHCLNWQGSGLSGWLRRLRMRRMEQRILSRASGITAASQPYLENALLLAGPRPSMVIYNGLLDNVVPVRSFRNDRFTMLYTGRIYEEQNWEGIIQALNALVERSRGNADAFVLQIYSQQEGTNANNAALRRFGQRTGMVEFRPPVSRGDMPMTGGRADVLLSVICEGNVGQVPLKLMDYMTFGPPVLLFGKTIGVQHELIQRTRTGHAVHDTEELITWLNDAMGAWRTGKHYAGHPTNQALQELHIDVQMMRWQQFILEVYQTKGDQG